MARMWNKPWWLLALVLAPCVAALFLAGCDHPTNLYYAEDDFPPEPRMHVAPRTQTAEEVEAKSKGCMSCHKGIENPSMHASEAVKIGCTDCHGGDGSVIANDLHDEEAKKKAHVAARGPWYHHIHDHHEHADSGNPKRTNMVWMKESPEFVRFINPGDLRVAKYACGECHAREVAVVPRSMMAHSAMLWNAALYNNGANNQKWGRFGEAYTWDGKPARIRPIKFDDEGNPKVYEPTEEEIKLKGELPYLDPLPRFNITQPGNVLRAFERGGKLKLETSTLDYLNDPGKPEFKLSIRGFGTFLSTDPVYLGLQKTRLVDPMLWHLGTSDQSGDYRSSGCTACHVVYANDRDPMHSGPYAKYGNQGHSFTKDEALAHAVEHKEHGHPISHSFTRSIPSSQCVVCHMHPGTTVTMTYYGNIWWDNETEGNKMYPELQKPNKSERQEYKIKVRNPEGAALRGKWGNVEFLEGLFDKNKDFNQVQFADYHGHGWIYRNVYKMDRQGNLLDVNNKVVPFDSPTKFAKSDNGQNVPGAAHHLMDIHMEKGMHCIDCHFNIDNHGNGKIYGEVRNATEITCIDCHGTVYEKATLKTTGNAAPEGGTDLSKTRTPYGRRFRWIGDKLTQQSAIDPDLKWDVPQTINVITPGHPSYNEKARYAKTVRRDNKTWGDVPEDPHQLAHQDAKMDCYVCHTSWMASCFGCHLPMRANQKRDNNHYEGAHNRNWTQYNFQTLREDVFMLGKDGTVKGNKVAPVRSACAVLVGSQNAQREWIYSQQQTVSAEGFSGQAFSPHFPHAVGGKNATKGCVDCHVSKEGDNNAWMAQVLMQGTNQVNFMYRILYVGCDDGGGLNAVVVTERDEPQAVIGSTLHKDAFPENYTDHVNNKKELTTYWRERGDVKHIQLRGEYVYAARGGGGMTVYDVANIDNKGHSDRIITAPVSPLGQRMYVKSEDCSVVLSPTVLGVDPTRQPPLRPRHAMNQEQPIALTYAFLYGLDRKEGLFTTLAGTLLDGDPTNNFLERHLTFNPDGILNGASNGTIAGNYLYVCCDKGLVVVDISKIGTELIEAALKLNPDGSKVVPLKKIVSEARDADPNELSVVGTIPFNQPKAVRIQFRYAFVLDADGLKVVDVTNPSNPQLVSGATVPIADGHNVYLSRTYAYVAAGKDGMTIIDITKPTAPKLHSTFNADGWLNDCRDVKIGMTNNSAFAYVANGKRGLGVIQLTSPYSVPGFMGWAPEPKPVLIATKDLPGVAVSVNEGLKRDRAVDESGNQLSVFSRVGSRPFNKTEMQAMYMLDGKLFEVSDTPTTEPQEIKSKATGGGALEAKLKDLEDKYKKERNPLKKRKLKQEIDALKEQIEAGGAGGALQKEIEDLKDKIKKERNPIKKRKLQSELKALEEKAAVAGAAGESAEKIQELEEKIKKERNPIKKRALQSELKKLKGE